METELRRIEELVGEIVKEMEYLRNREQKLRDTNESTNNRVKTFGLGTTGLLIALWAWQIIYLRAYFRYVIYGRTDQRLRRFFSASFPRPGVSLTRVLRIGLSISSKRLQRVSPRRVLCKWRGEVHDYIYIGALMGRGFGSGKGRGKRGDTRFLGSHSFQVVEYHRLGSKGYRF